MNPTAASKVLRVLILAITVVILGTSCRSKGPRFAAPKGATFSVGTVTWQPDYPPILPKKFTTGEKIANGMARGISGVVLGGVGSMLVSHEINKKHDRDSIAYSTQRSAEVQQISQRLKADVPRFLREETTNFMKADPTISGRLSSNGTCKIMVDVTACRFIETHDDDMVVLELSAKYRIMHGAKVLAEGATYYGGWHVSSKDSAQATSEQYLASPALVSTHAREIAKLLAQDIATEAASTIWDDEE